MAVRTPHNRGFAAPRRSFNVNPVVRRPSGGGRARDFTRVDFLVDLGPRSRAGRIGHYSALALDPITPFTHPDPQADKDKRTSLELGGYLLVFLDTEPMKLNPKRIIEAALVGKDLSSRA
jgi:hypothetical protein